VDRALKAIEGVGRAVHAHLKSLVVVISARFAFGHDCLPLTWAILQNYNPPHPASVPKPRPSASLAEEENGVTPGATGNSESSHIGIQPVMHAGTGA
jgi:hypothetical protein